MSADDKLRESIRTRIEKMKSTEDAEVLRETVCPFFELGGCPDCAVCLKEEDDVRACRDEYLEKIILHPMDIWSEEFDVTAYKKRDVTPAEDLIGIGVNCNFCYMSDKCPLYKRDHVCGIQWDNNRPQSPKEFMDFLINTQFERVRRASVFEKIDGGVPDANLSGEMDRLRDYVLGKSDMDTNRLSINVEAKGSASGGGGILAQIFGKPAAAPALPADEQPALPAPEIEGHVVDAEPVKLKRKRNGNNEREEALAES